MANSSLEPSSHRPTARFSVASLALLIAVFSCLLLSTDFSRWRERYHALIADGVWVVVVLALVAGIAGGLIGLVSAFSSRLSWRIRVLAPIAGALAGETALFILLAPGPLWRTIFAVV